MTEAHSRLGASSMYRWSACPGSVRLCEGVESKSSKYAEEGSDAHALAAYCLRRFHNPGFHIGKWLDSDGRHFFITQEMADAVQVYVDAVREAAPEGTPLQVEQRFDLSEVHDGCFGTADAVVWRDAEKRLTVFDYKHGAGLPVTVENNPQLQYYGLGALLASGYPARTVRLVIVQPRCDHPDGPVRSWEIDAIDLLDFRADLKAYAAATEKPGAPLVPGDHCRFCPAAPLCPALAAKAQDVAKLDFGPALSYDPQKLTLALDSLPVLEGWIKNVREFAYAEAEAGRMPPGYKLVAKRAMRKWRDEGEVIDALQTVYSDEDLFEPRKLRSPAQMEKVVPKDTLAPFITAESSGHALVPESDKRPAVRLDAKEEFAAISE